MHDVVIIGGGPGGSTTASLLAASGHDIALFERDHFPRFHIGESLLPQNMRIFERLGLIRTLEERFTEKWGVEFISSSGDTSQRYSFDRGIDATCPRAFQVLRSEFDLVLLKRAETLGAKVRQGAAVKFVERVRDGTWRLELETDKHGPEAVSARYLVDASGSSAFLASRLGLRRMSPTHRRATVFAHYRGVSRRPGRDAGNIVMVLFSDGWLWFIPLENGVTSVGVVLESHRMKEQGCDTGELLDRALAGSPAAWQLMQKAERISPPRTASDWTYTSQHFVGDGYMLVGDAGAFVDPVFSSGVLLAMSSGEIAADLLDVALRKGNLSRRSLMPFERIVVRHIASYQRVVDVFYSPAFSKLCLFPEKRLGIPEAIINVLGGNLDPPWAIRWRLELFYLIAAMMRRFDVGQSARMDRLFARPQGAASHGAASGAESSP